MPTTPPRDAADVRRDLENSIANLPEHAEVHNRVDDLVAAGLTPSDKQFAVAFGGGNPQRMCTHTVEALREKLASPVPTPTPSRLPAPQPAPAPARSPSE